MAAAKRAHLVGSAVSFPRVLSARHVTSRRQLCINELWDAKSERGLTMSTTPSAPTGAPGGMIVKVHGVAGTPPSQILDCPPEFIEATGGDRSAGFYGRRQALENICNGEDFFSAGLGKRNIRTEAYSWGRLTSGSAFSALGLLLLPFVFVNLSYWMVLPTSKRVAGVIGSALRVLGLLFTLALMVALVGICVDLVGWQCAVTQECTDRLGPASFIHQLPRGVQIAVTSLPVLLFVLPAFSRKPYYRGSIPPAVSLTDDGGFASETFWIAATSENRLRACHVTAWLSGLSAILLVLPALHAVSWWRAIATILLAISLAFMMSAVVATASQRFSGRGNDFGRTRSFRWPQYVALVQVIVALALLCSPYVAIPGPLELPHLPGFIPAAYFVVGVEIPLLLAVFIATALARRGRTYSEGYQPAFGGFGAPVVATVGWLIGGAFWVGLAIFVARYLGRPVATAQTLRCETGWKQWLLETAEHNTSQLLAACDANWLADRQSGATSLSRRIAAFTAEAPLLLPGVYYWIALASLGMLVGLLIVLVGNWLLIRSKVTRAGHGPNSLAAQAEALAGVTERLPGVVLAVLGVTSVSAVAAFYVTKSELSREGGVVTAVLGVLTDWSQALLGGAAVLFVVLAYRAFRDRNLRRTISVLWDVAMFWPRSSHPLGTQSYGARVVWDLRIRLHEISAGETPVPVVIAAHSQGSVIAVANILQSPEYKRQSVGLMTYGSPLRRLYGRYFPAYFNHQTMEKVSASLNGRWINLWAASDPIGSWIFDPKGAQQPSIDRQIGEPPLCGHLGYERYRDFYGALNDLFKLLEV